MASFDFEPNSGRYHIRFRYGGQPFKRVYHLGSDAEARRVCALVEETLQDLKRGKLSLPPDAEPGAFILSGGKTTGKPTAPQKPLTLGDLLVRYEADFPMKAKEQSTHGTEAIHRRHLRRLLGEKLSLDSVNPGAIQRYADRRAGESFRGRSIRRDTILKELATLRVIWNWGIKGGYVARAFPLKFKDLVLPRSAEKASFRTFREIRAFAEGRTIVSDGSECPWESLYLDSEEVREVLGLVKERSAYPWIYPMVAFAALTGARRSEICRSERSDFDFESGSVLIREKKRVLGRDSYRRVDLHETLQGVVHAWFSVHPGGPFTISQNGGPITRDQAHDHLKRTLRGTKWEVLPGFHTFRHSFASILAARGVEETTIAHWMGHQTEAQRARYRHLFPSRRRAAINLL